MTRGRIPELDGIRALAILAVLAVHGFAGEAMHAYAATWDPPARAAFAVIEHGWLGVDLFFVLSGFLITGILLDTRERRTYFRDFWVRRGLRILPLVIAVVAILAVIYRPPALLVVMALFFAVDFAPLAHVGDRAFGPLWSLAVEEQFYLVWPFLVFVLRRGALLWVTVFVIAVEPLIRIATAGGLFDVLWCRLDGLALGAFVAIYVRSRFFGARTTAIGAGGAVMAALAMLVATVHAPIAASALRVTEADLFFAAMVAVAVTFSGAGSLAALRSRTARFVADTSFCVYLIHVPLLDLAHTVGLGARTTNPLQVAALQAAFAFPLAFAVAALSRRYYELPFLRLKDRFAPEPRLPSMSRLRTAHVEERPRLVEADAVR